jgi:dienelactone hydrolase
MLQAVLRPACAWLTLLLLAGGCGTAAVRFPNATPGAPLSVPGRLLVPWGPGPFPAVLLLAGCHGVSPSTLDWARWFRDRGHVALVVDSLAARGMTENCTMASVELPNTARFDDAVGGLRFLHGRPEVDRERIGVIGWSNGGVFALALVNGPSHARARARGVELPEPGFRAAVAVYPGGCFSLVHETVVRPLLVLMGEADDWVEPDDCVAMVRAMRGRGADATIVLYPGVHHYFDDARQPRAWLPDVVNRNRPGGCCGATVAHDPEAAADARRRVAEFFGYHLGAR